MSSSSVAAHTPGLSIHLGNYTADLTEDWQAMFDKAQAADRAGIDRVGVSEHVVFGENLEAYGRAELGGTEGGKQPTGPDGTWLDPLTVLTMVAAQTKHVRLQTGILVAALRRPVVLAKTAATIDVLSGGRLDLGVGVGWQREEYEAAGLDFDGRGKLLDHTLAVCQTLWRDMTAHYEDPYLHFESIHMMPKPLQPGGVPIWVSGTLNARVLQRIVRFGSGWVPWGPDARELKTSLGRVHEALAAAGRDVKSFQVPGNLPNVKDANGKFDLARSVEAVPALVDAGVTDFRINLPIPAELNAAVDFLSEIVTAFRKTVGRPLDS
ncbi:MAG TPA: TIGR03619 family F420-dependent LLM class oxidoreductase [Acidimicrobiales bacterium]|jgi:probable F420-dependent oxidoreductase|nr:TIGR03619 family F420-dependent LLM class oxidoreductase [Acidimicrobiales bacterium]